MEKSLDALLARTRQEGGCLRWQGSHTQTGYGQAWIPPRMRTVHRLAYELVNGEVPAGLEIDHLCRTRDCVNIDHLEAVTHRENLLRSKNFIGEHARKTHCVNGHEFTPENTKTNGRGWRICRECRRTRARQYKASARAEAA